ncbi:MAG: GNAT family N-acetyltransferase [Lewinellaceae bacterium]|nr:GNAT family N-acetyltransferase [Lewinellaceae bacterium]
MLNAPTFTTLPLTPDTWLGLENLFGEKGACGGCWCMLWRLPKKIYNAGKGDGNKSALQQIVQTNKPPGILGYLDGQVVAWCSLGPRTDFQGLERSRILRPVDDTEVWSLSCLFIDKKARRQGLSKKMILAAADYARSQGAAVLEAYPIAPKNDKIPDAFAWTGILQPFLDCGFREVARRSETRPILQLHLL